MECRLSGEKNIYESSSTGDFSCVTFSDYRIRKQYRITDPAKVFVSPDYSSIENKNSRVIDFRNTHYWNPSVKPGKDGKVTIEFRTSDIHSVYEINVQGITGDGEKIG
jgi:hypothetical protein